VDNLETLRALMKRHNLTTQDVADLLCVKLNTVESWLSVGQTRPVTDRQLTLLKRLIPSK
jgi:transcriptional regulator with XRE-family HTH domain